MGYEYERVKKNLSNWLVDLLRTKLLNHVETDYKDHNKLIKKHINNNAKLLFIAHSQGNLFVHNAYRYAEAIHKPNSVFTLHIGSASRKLSGDYILVDKDYIIKALSKLGYVPEPNISIPFYNPLDGSNRDFLGHSLVGTYLNPKLPAPITAITNYVNEYIDIFEQEMTAENSKINDKPIFTATLSWHGFFNDALLHTIKPDGTIYMLGDPPKGFGRASLNYLPKCEHIQTGIYIFNITNNAANRTATFTIKDFDGKQLHSKNISFKQNRNNLTPIGKLSITEDAAGYLNITIID